MQRRGKLILTAVILVLLSGLLCGFTQNTLPEEQQLFLDHLDRYLAFSEGVHAQMREMLDRAEEFAKDGTWDSLLKARAACCSAKSWLGKLELPEFTLTDSQFEALLDAGIEADAIQQEYWGLKDTRDAYITDAELLTDMLENDFLLEANMSAFPQWLESKRDQLKAESEYLCLMTNYLLLQLDGQGLWEKMPAAYPCISEGMQAWDSAPSSLMEECAAVLNRYEETLKGSIQYSAASEYSHSVIQEAVDTGDYTRLSGQLYTAAGVPGYIPMPHWLPKDAETFYCVRDAGTGELRLVKDGQTVTQTPCSCYISCGEISREDVDAYIDEMTQRGYTVGEKEEDGTCLWLITDGKCALSVQWTASETVLYLNEPIACLIPAYFISAMLQK